MDFVLLSDEAGKNEFTGFPLPEGCRLTWFDHLPQLPEPVHADLLVDLLFDNDPQRIAWLQQPGFSSVLVNSSDVLPSPLVAINGWAGFIGSDLIEGCCDDELTCQRAGSMVARLGRRIEWTAPGAIMIGQRIVSSIINEAFLTVEEQTATPEAIDVAMKLGTNYPYGPFAWAAMIGHRNLMRVLDRLTAENPHYQVSTLLKENALAQ